jgi:ATP synthase protein I
MPERNGQSDTPASDLDELESKLKAARARREGSKQKDEDRDNSMLGMAWRLSTELLAAVLVGFLLGYGVDTLLGSRPWGTLVGLAFGIAAGFMGVFRTAAAMDAKNADIPIGDDLPPDSRDEI